MGAIFEVLRQQARNRLNTIEEGMKRAWKSACGKSTAALVVLLCGILAGQPAMAEGEGFFTSRRSLGMVFLGGSVVLVKQGLDFKDEADGFYDRYKLATDSKEIDRLYQRTNNRDVKSQVSWAMAAAFGVSGLRLILSGGSAKSYQKAKAPAAKTAIASGGPGLSLESQIDPGRIGLRLKKSFF